jgi:hypothetical protein
LTCGPGARASLEISGGRCSGKKKGNGEGGADLRAWSVSERKKERGTGDGPPMESGEWPMGGGGGGGRCGAADVERPMGSGQCGQAGSAKQKQCTGEERVRFRVAADGSRAADFFSLISFSFLFQAYSILFEFK